MKLYHISEDIVSELLKNITGTGKQIVIKEVSGFKYPLKVVCDIAESLITVITVYPLKRGKK